VTKLVSRHLLILGVFSYLSMGSLQFVEGMNAHAKDVLALPYLLSPKLLNQRGMKMVLVAKLEAV